MNKLLPYFERVFLATLVIGFILQLLGMEIPILMTIGLGGLGVTFFLNAYRPLDIQTAEGEQMGFNELLGLSIIPKVLWISTAIATIGILFYTLQIGDNGYIKMLHIGGITIITASIAMLILKAIGTKYLNATFPIYFRALPTVIVVAYILFG
jgi:hypothetical protein